MFGHVRRLQESVTAHEALRLTVNTLQVTDPMTGRTGSVREVVLDISRSGVQLEVDVGHSANAGWDMAGDRDVWRARNDPSPVPLHSPP